MENKNIGEFSGRGDHGEAGPGPGRTTSTTTTTARERPPSSISFIDLSGKPSQTQSLTTGGGSGSTTKSTPIVDNLLSMIPMGHEKAMRYAFYNVLAMVLAGGLLFMMWGVYCVLDPFLKSLLWAVLVGTVMYPFKKNLSGTIRQWLQNVKNSSAPFVIHLVTVPIVIVDNVSDIIGSNVIAFWKSTLAGLGIFLLTYFTYYNPPSTLVTVGHWFGITFWNLLIWSLQWTVNLPLVVALNVIYIGHLVTSTFQRMKSTSTNESAAASSADTTDSQQQQQQNDQSNTNNDIITSTTNESQNRQQNYFLTNILPYLSLTITFIYICLNVLPYSFLIGLVIFVTLGIVTYIQGGGTEEVNSNANNKTVEQQKVIPSVLSHYAAIVALNIGVTSPISTTPKNSSSTASLEERRARLQKSWSEGSGFGGGGGGRQLSSKSPSEQSIQEHSSSNVMDKNQSEIMDDSIDGLAEHEEAVLLDSNKFLYGVFCAICIVQMWNHPWIMRMLPLPVVYYGLKKLCKRTGINDYIYQKIGVPIKEFMEQNLNSNDSSSSTDEENEKVQPLKLIFRILTAADRRLVSICEDCLDPVASILVLTFVGIATILIIIFMSIQIYSEGDHLVRVSIDLINSTVSQYPEINAMLPDGWESIMTSMVSNAYHYGRETITNMIRDSISEKNPEKAEQIEKQLIELWDKVYETWNQTWENVEFPNQILNEKKNNSLDWDGLLETGKEVPNLLELSVLTNYAKANIGTLWTVFESLWNILISNVSLVFSAMTSILSVVFGGGSAILNLILNFVIFFTSLFYLLSSSTDVYKPVEVFSLLSPNRNNNGNNGTTRTTGFARAVEEAVNGVFAASFKMAAFYGMWTWLIHTLFQVNIVFLPTITAAMFGAVPILATYFAALPAVLELWLIQGQWPKALFMFLAQMAPMSMVDTQIYSEIKGGGHPYLTGLAIAGGIFYFGIQGAIMGPVILCCVFVAIKVGTSFMRDDISNSQLAVK